MKFKLYNKRFISLPLIIIALLFAFAVSCEEEALDTTPPGVISITEVEPLNGGAKISYTLPNDEDILYVRAEYTNSLGVEVFKVSRVNT